MIICSNNRTDKYQGFSLLELLIALSLLTILLLAAVPAMQNLVSGDRTTQTVNRLIGAIHYARSEAIQLQQIITFCGSSDKKSCDGHWRDGQIIITADNRVLRIYEPLAPRDGLRWQSSLGKNNYLRFAPSGFTYGQQGSFYYCPSDKNLAYARAVVILQSGRTRVERKPDNACGGG